VTVSEIIDDGAMRHWQETTNLQDAALQVIVVEAFLEDGDERVVLDVFGRVKVFHGIAMAPFLLQRQGRGQEVSRVSSGRGEDVVTYWLPGGIFAKRSARERRANGARLTSR
jgi:hypothetical protein